MATNELAAEGTTFNAGLLDPRFASEYFLTLNIERTLLTTGASCSVENWIKKYISKFGGDPVRFPRIGFLISLLLTLIYQNQITIHGQSGGGVSDFLFDPTRACRSSMFCS